MTTQFRNLHMGRRAFLIASGPSVARMDLAWLADEITICVNQSHKALGFDPTYICIGDRELWPRVKAEYARKRSTIICSGGTTGAVGKDYAGTNLGLVVPMNRRRRVDQGDFSIDMLEVCCAFNVVPEIALPFALHCGFSELYLIGCDCTDDGYFYPRGESARPEWPQQVLPEAMRAYEVIARYAEEQRYTRIFNAGYGGRLEAFERVNFDALRPGAPPPPLVVGYHTPHNRYRELAAQMAASVERFGIETDIREWPNRGVDGRPTHMNWVVNCAICPEFILAMMDAHPGRDLIYLDADAVMERRPALYLDAPRNYDFAAPYLTNAHVTRELQSNSLYFAATPAARALAEAWKSEQQRRTLAMLGGKYRHPFREAWDQQVLQDVVPRVSGLRAIELPPTYAKIMPTPSGIEITPHVPLTEAVITQHQASREMRMKIGSAIDAPPAPLPVAQHYPWRFTPELERWAHLQVTGNHMPLDAKFELLSRAEWGALAPHAAHLLKSWPRPRRVLDLACGLGRVSVFLNRRFETDAEFVLADTTQDVRRPRYGYNTYDDFYNSLEATAEFCRLNGLHAFRTFDVRADDWNELAGWPDLIISMLGIGFHVPLECEIERLHALARPDTVLAFGIGCEADAPDWEREHDFTRWFARQVLVPFKSEYPTHEGRVLILGDRR
jgi:SAM-dependent methyltransferase